MAPRRGEASDETPSRNYFMKCGSLRNRTALKLSEAGGRRMRVDIADPLLLHHPPLGFPRGFLSLSNWQCPGPGEAFSRRRALKT